MIHAYDLGGASRGQAPTALATEWVCREAELATLKVSYSELAPRASQLDGVAEVAYLVPAANGKDWVEPPNARFIVSKNGWERLKDGTRTHSYDCVSLASELAFHHLTAGVGTERTFSGVTAGALLKTFVDEVQGAGGLPWLELGFTATVDSRGEAWPHYTDGGGVDGVQVHTEVIQLRTADLFTVLQGMPRIIWWMQGRTLHVAPWKPGADRAIHLPDSLMTESPEAIDHSVAASHITILGDEGYHKTFAVPGVNPAYGKRVRTVQVQGITDDGSAALRAEEEYPAARDAAESFTRQWRVSDGTPWIPGRDLLLGEWITADTKDGRRIRSRIAGMSVSEGKDGRSAFVTLGTVRDGLLMRMAKQQRNRAGGVGVIHGTPKPVPPPVAGRQWPEAPQNVQATLSGWPLPGGGHGGVIGASWNAVTTDTVGNAMEPDGYTVRARKQGTTAWIDPLFRTDPDDLLGNMEPTGGLVPGDTWEVQVAGMEGDDTGTWSAVWSGQVVADTQAPNVPSKLTGRSEPAQVVLEWDGKDSAGQPMSLDLKHIEVAADGVTKTWTMGLQNRSLRIDAGPGKDLAIGSTYTFRARSVDYVPNVSDWSEPVHIAVRTEIVWPAAPGSLIVEAASYMTAEGDYRGMITATWTAVTTDTDGQPVDIEAYPVLVRRTAGPFVVDWFHLGEDPGLSWTGSSPLMQVGDTWEVKVAARSTDGHTGPSSDVVVVVIPPDETAPDVPSTPLVSSSRGAAIIEWDGLTKTAGPMPLDLDYLAVYQTGVTEPVARIHPIARTVAIFDLVIGDTYEFRLTAMDRAGNESAPSQPDSVVIVSAIGDIQPEINRIEDEYTAADAALQGQIDSIVIASSGGNVTWAGSTTPVAPSDRPHRVGDIWHDSGTRTIKRYDGTNWVVHQLGDASIFELSAAKITTGFLDSARIKAGSIWTDKLLIGSQSNMVVDPGYTDTTLNAARVLAPWTFPVGKAVASAAGYLWLNLTNRAPASVVVTDPLPGTATYRYRISATVKAVAAGSVSLVWRNAGATTVITGPVALTAGQIFILEGELVWPTLPTVVGVQVTAAAEVTAPVVTLMASQVLIQNGIISAPKLAANAVEADKIAAGAVNALKLSADAIDGKLITGAILTGGIVRTNATAQRGIWLNGNDNTLKSFNLSTGVEEFRVASGDIQITGAFQTRGAFPHFDIKRNLWADFSGMQWTIGPGWQTKPEIITNASKWGNDLPGGLYVRGGNNHGLTMRPEVALRSGRPVDGTDQFWPSVDMILGIGNTTHGLRQLQDVGQNKTRIYDMTDFWKAEIRGGALIEMPMPATVNDIQLRTNGGITLWTGNTWLRTEGIGSTGGGQDLALEGNWRVTFRSSLSKYKLEQAETGPLYELLEVPAMTWVDRSRREADPDWDVRYGGVIYEDVAQVSAEHGGSLDHLLITRGGEPSGIAYNAIAPMLLPIVADMERRITILEAERAAL